MNVRYDTAKKLAYFDEYLRIYWTDFRNIFTTFFTPLPDDSTVLDHYYLLGGDTAAPSGLYARLCHAFLVILFF